jgi:hypothetical protein
MRPPTAFSGGGLPINTLPIEKPLRRPRLHAVRAALDQRACGAEPRQPGIQHRQILQADADAAEPHCQAGRFACRKHERGTGLCQSRGQSRRANRIEDCDGRNVEREL